jgi:hypothetical protein
MSQGNQGWGQINSTKLEVPPYIQCLGTAGLRKPKFLKVNYTPHLQKISYFNLVLLVYNIQMIVCIIQLLGILCKIVLRKN